MPVVEKRVPLQARLSVSALGGVSAALLVFLMVWTWWFPYTGDGDSVLHYHTARETASNIAAGISAWARPAYTLPLALFATHGMAAARFFTALITLAAFWQTVRLAEDLRLRAPLAAGFMMIFQASAFALLTDTMTEMPMALGVVVAVRLWVAGRWGWSGLLVGFLPMVRPEGYFFGVLWGLLVVFGALSWKRKGGTLFLMTLGLVTWAVLCRVFWNEWLGFLPNNNWPMNPAGAVRGPLWYYPLRWPECVGLPLFAVWCVGVWRIVRDRMPAWLLILGIWGLVFGAHAVFFWRGLFASWGLIRILACVAPMTAVICLLGWQVFSDTLRRRQWPAWTWGRPGLAALVTAAGVWAVAYYVILEEHFDCFPITRIARHMEGEKLVRPDRFVMCGNQMLLAVLGADPKSKLAADLPVDQAACWKRLREIPEGELLVWDNRQSTTWYRISIEQLDEAGFTILHSESLRTPLSVILGIEPMRYVLLRKDTQMPEMPPESPKTWNPFQFLIQSVE